MVVFADTSPTIIKQTYRFKTLPDDGSYSLIISNISGDFIVSGHEGSGAFINVEKITFGIKKEEHICNCSDIDDIIVFCSDGSYKVVKINEKVFVNNITYTSLEDINSKGLIKNFEILGLQDDHTK